MFVISLHNICLSAPIGLYPQEALLKNNFEIDVDVWVVDYAPNTFVDYTLLNKIIQEAFKLPETILEQLAQKIYADIKTSFVFAQKVRIAIRKKNPPMTGQTGYAQVVLER